MRETVVLWRLAGDAGRADAFPRVTVSASR